jgi:hypothetical protein
MTQPHSRVIAGLDPAIHDKLWQMQTVRFALPRFIMDARVKPAHDDGKSFRFTKAYSGTETRP